MVGWVEVMLSLNNVFTGIWIGTRGTVAENRLFSVGARFRRTKRRSADTTGVTTMVMLKKIGEFCGWKTSCEPNGITFTCVRTNWASLTLMNAVWPLNTVIFGACMTF